MADNSSKDPMAMGAPRPSVTVLRSGGSEDRGEVNRSGSGSGSDIDIEKNPQDVNEKALNEKPWDDSAHIQAVEAFEERLANDEAADAEYLVTSAHDVAIKVLSTRDDPELPALTFRFIFLGLGFSAFGSVLAQIYYFKPQTLLVSQLFLLIMTYWFGNGMHYILPQKGFFKWLNPGPFNIKEHCATIIMCSTAASSATAIQVISVQDLYYNHKVNPGIAIFTLIGSQLIGYGFAGILQPGLVWPTKAFWPQIISSANLFQALHFDNGFGSKRVRLFWMVFAGIFCWEIIPQWMFPLLTGISIFCLADNNSATLRNVFGGASNNEGMGFLALCLDWNLIGSSSMVTPIWTQINQYLGMCLCYILMASLYYGNTYKALSFPFMSQALFNADGTEYNQTLILTNNEFDASKYATVGPAYFSVTNALYLITSNLSIGAVLTHTALFFWDDIKPFAQAMNPWRKGTPQSLVKDEHFEKMKAYKPVPQWWFYALLVGAFAMAQATNYTGHSQLPWWACIVLLLIDFIFCTCYSVLGAYLGFSEFNSSGQGFYQMITAYMLPGKPVANMYGALYGQHPMQQAIALLQDLKLGQYVKVPPRVTFLAQTLGTIVGAILNYVIMLSIISANRPALLSISGTRLWSGQNAQAYNSNAISWGALGPQMFGKGSTYEIVPISLAIGVVLPLPFYILHRIWPTKGFQNINTAIILQYGAWLTVGINTSVNTTVAIGIFSQLYLRRRKPRWFTKYNYITAAALDGGNQVISFILNFAIFGAAGHAHRFPNWWGNPATLSADRCKAPPE